MNVFPDPDETSRHRLDVNSGWRRGLFLRLLIVLQVIKGGAVSLVRPGPAGPGAARALYTRCDEAQHL